MDSLPLKNLNENDMHSICLMTNSPVSCAKEIALPEVYTVGVAGRTMYESMWSEDP